MNECRLSRLSRPWFESPPSVLGSLRSMARVMRPVGFALVSSTTLGGSVAAQQRTVADSTRDSTVVLRPIEVSVTRRQTSLFAVPFAVAIVGRDELLRGRATLGLDEALASVPGLFIANRYNPTLDQRISIRGFGSRSAFGARGVKILLDGIPQTLPDGQGQLTNVEISSLGAVEVLRGSSSSLYGNASGGVILLRTATPEPGRTEASGRMVGGAYGMVKFSGRVAAPAGRGTIVVSGARTVTDGFRDHSKAEINNVGVRFEQELSAGMSVLVSTHWAKNPTLDNPGSLTRGEVDTLPSQANARNVGADAGKAVEQGQLGVTLTKLFRSGASIGVTAFGLKRDLNNPLSFAFIRIDREALGARATVAVPLSGSLDPRLTFGVDLQRQRDDRVHRTTDRATITRDQLERVRVFEHSGICPWDGKTELVQGQHDLSELRSLQDWYLRYELTSVEGVAEVAAIGGFVR
ncbi:MAG: TonB-dependent receptor plug domain-containing protein, partial [Gemmatimonadetes bacterium]|nr:TonB-dependent receptor plug domain-containing protein [Gemmatimonadota bacterium]